MREVVHTAIQALAPDFAAKNIAVANQIPDSLPPLHVDGPKFARLFDLLLKDELACLPAGSRATLTAQLLDGGDKPELLLELSDNGPGIPEEALRVIFDPFVVRSDAPSEYGINLMACYFIVFHHGGKIEARSDPGRGATFTLRLPLHPEHAMTPADDQEFLRKVLLNEALWQKLISSD